MIPGPGPSWQRQAYREAAEHGIAVGEVDYLIGEITGLDRLQLCLGGPDLLAPWESALDRLWHRRVQERVPVQYLVGRVYWRNLVLTVGPATLIPRPETELLVDHALHFCRSLDAPVIADLGTGTGAIAIALAIALPNARLFAVDCSADALALARKNVETYDLGGRVFLLEGSWFAPLPADLRFDAVLSNPPYIPTALVASLAAEVRLHEPILALDGGADGLDHLDILVDEAPRHLRPGGLWAVEVMAGQAQQVATRLEDSGRYTDIQIYKDWAGIERFVTGYASAQ